MNLKQPFQILSICFFFFFASCTKQEQQLTQEQKEQNAIDQIKSIVGNNGTITLIKKESSTGIKSNSNDTVPKIVSITEFKKIYSLLSSKFSFSDSGTVIIEKDTSGLASFADGPIPKRYSIRFSSPTGQDLILNYGVDANKMVQNPYVSLTGLPLTQFLQTGLSNIEFNPFYKSSTFTVTLQYTVTVAIPDGNGGNTISISYTNNIDVDFTIYGTTSGIVGWR